MTEYDYSPQAVARFHDKQRSIHRWVRQTEQANPITLAQQPHVQRSQTYSGTVTSRPSQSSSSRPPHRRSNTDHHHRSSHSHSRHHSRSRTSSTPHYASVPAQNQMQMPYTYAQQGQAYYNYQQPAPPAPSPRRVVTSPNVNVVYYPAPQTQKQGVLSRLMNFMGVNTDPKPIHVSTSRSSSRRKSKGKRDGHGRRYSY